MGDAFGTTRSETYDLVIISRMQTVYFLRKLLKEKSKSA